MVVVAALAAGGCGGKLAFHSSTTPHQSTSTPATTTATAAAAPTESPRIIDGSFYSPAVRGTLHYQVALPPGYATNGKRYPVLYMLHGLPASAGAYKGVAAVDLSIFTPRRDEYTAEEALL